MAIDKVVDSAALDSDLLAVADAIRTKGGTAGALTFPEGFVAAIEALSTGGGSDRSAGLIDGTLETYENPDVTVLRQYAFYTHAGIKHIVLPNVDAVPSNCFRQCTALISVDLGNPDLTPSYKGIEGAALANNTALKTLILRYSTPVKAAAANILNGASGVTVYVPQSLIAEYTAATNWSSFAAAGTVTFAALEGSAYA